MYFVQSKSCLTLLSFLACSQSYAQYQALSPQSDVFNSSINVTSTQQKSAGINATLANNIAVALNFERSNFANGSAASENFYYVPPEAVNATLGTVLKVELDANTSAYTLPPNTAISRFLFQSESINGSKVPVSAYILWPYLARTQPDGLPVVAWAHGTSGVFGNCAPSQYRNLLYQFATVFELAMQGYVVIAPDYVSLGVTKDARNTSLVHPYLGNPSHANDLFFAVQAAQAAFPVLSKRFVIMGHSQGGGAAWSAAVRQAQRPVDGYLGAIAGSPVTDITNLIKFGTDIEAVAASFLALTLADLYPRFSNQTLLTPSGLSRLNLISELQGCLSTATELFADDNLVQPDWVNNDFVKSYSNLTSVVGKAIAGPMLVLQGDSDDAVPIQATTEAVHETCARHPDSQLQYSTFAGVSHVPVMFASQRLWLDFIEARFAGNAVADGCQRTNYSSVRPYQYYQKEQNWFVEYATVAYETA